uniref:BPTI/Kunitz inhibitor domain-containing protein n=1 Tax=Amblyomma maculatum TaxID=34609 RepID=G3MPR5_AMBMU
MKFLSIILLWGLNGVVPSPGDGLAKGEALESQSNGWETNVCFLRKNGNGTICQPLGYEIRYYYHQETDRCISFIPKSCGTTDGNNFAKREDCIKKCMPFSHCLVKKTGRKNNTNEGYTYLLGPDMCISAKYGVNAKYWPNANRFHTSYECHNTCAPGEPRK